MEEHYSLISYSEKEIISFESDYIAELLTQTQDEKITWIVVNGYTSMEPEAMERLLAHFAMTTVSAEQILAHDSVEFMSEYTDCLFIEFDIPIHDTTLLETVQTQGCIILGDRFLLLFVAQPTDIFDHARERLLLDGSKAQQQGADYLLYLLIRTVIAKIEYSLYRTLVERFEELEDVVIASNGEPIILDKILAIREHVKPFYESARRLAVMIDTIYAEGSQFISQPVGELFHTNLEQDVVAMWDGYARLRHWVVELMDIHRANVGERTNRVMHILTVVSTIFLPITFLASLYGMNFNRMPFLRNPYGYPYTLLTMLLIVVVMVVYMKRKDWI